MSLELISREDELAVIEAFMDRPAAGPSALVLEGEAGIGKSALWLAGVESARRRGFRVLVSRPAETEQTLPNVVLGDLFGEVTPDELTALPPPRRRAFESALLLQDASDMPIDPRALDVAILTLLPSLASGQPLVLAIDDDQWIDPSSAATLAFALRRLERLPARLLLSRRTGAAPTAELEEALIPTEVERVRVGALSPGAVQLLVRERLGITLSRPMVSQLHEVSGGNPFYALELARARVGEPALDSTMPLIVPASLERLVDARLGALDAQTRAGLLLIAAHGRFPVGFERSLDVPPEAIDQAQTARVIETAAGVVRFTHPLLASAVYQGASAADRRGAHHRLATLLDDPVPRGRHLALSTDGIDEALASELEAAASVALERGLSIAAAELAEHALRLTPPDAAEDRHRRAIAAARAHLAAGEGGRARTISDDLLAASPAGRRRAETLILRSELEAPDAQLALREEALAEARDAPDLRAALHAGLAEAGFFGAMKTFAWMDRHARAALRLAERLEDDTLRADALSIVAMLRFSHGEPHSHEMAERAYGLAAVLTDPRHVARAVASVGFGLAWSAPAEEARDWLEGRLATWADRDERVRYEIVSYLALVEFRAGRWDVASDYADQVHEISEGYGLLSPYDFLVSALVALHRGELEVARAIARHALALGEGQQLELFYAIVAMCDLWAGDPEAAVANFMLAEGAADVQGEDEPTMRFWRAEYVEGLLQLGHVDDAARLTADWDAAAQQLGRARVIAQAAHCRGLIAAARGDVTVAAAVLQEAVDRHENSGDPFGRARALLALGVALRRTRKKRAAREAMGAALAGFLDLGAAGWAATTRAELGRIGGRQRMEGLSPSELSVARLAAEGRTNREIASALFLGERTVASHLGHIYAKLGIRSRTELARLLPRSEEPTAET
ncbi:MAG TPA: AAA family ATPase [Candidatus Limnocylindria bacterium]|nr:AAA family ATPase [Candidatus Limnocylindria bacterium]